MLVTPRKSGRTAKPATIVANHIKDRNRANAGRSSWIAFHHVSHKERGETKRCGSGLAAWVCCILPVESMP
jgi:hypothetical protein